MGDRWFGRATAEREVPAVIDTSVAHPARIYDYLLGGKDNFAADRKAAQEAASAFPYLGMAMRENRAVMRRMVTFLASELGIRQYLDIGTGLPTSPNVHEIAQAITPGVRVVYVDNDPIVLAHARALLIGSEPGATAYIDADMREPGRILGDPQLLRTLNLSQPVALLLFGTLHFIPEEDDPYGLVARLMSALPSGSYLAAQHPSADHYPAGRSPADAYRRAGIAYRNRSKDEFTRFFTGLELVPPGIGLSTRWRAGSEPQPRPPASQVGSYAGLARKP
ncbi:MAG TPA: SAM-dependent methyltransferase [Streptosporangiaceae bacterium]|nr:SAM-dependent methyltransferase [Streptosporangiaceae bacterium]